MFGITILKLLHILFTVERVHTHVISACWLVVRPEDNKMDNLSFQFACGPQ